MPDTASYRTYCELPPKKLYFKPKEVAEILKEATSTIRWWATQYGIRNKGTQHKDNMTVYTMRDVARLHVIKNLVRVEKFSPEGVRQKLKSITI